MERLGPLWSEKSFALIDEPRPLLFAAPLRAIEAYRPEDVAGALTALGEAAARGLYAAGFFSYELGYCLEPKLLALLPPERTVPLLSFGIFKGPEILSPGATEALLLEEGGYRLSDVNPRWSLTDYRPRFAAVREWIAAGDAYQVNLTFPLDFTVGGSPAALYGALRRRARAGHGAFLALEGLSVLSLSPELFLECKPPTLRTRPMKGTAPREPTLARDEIARAALAADPKSRAENLMIVDLLRNDLGRIGETGSVHVDELFTVETYPTLHTMTSTISARIREGTDLARILGALFPSGSVTGAPKIRAMEIIRALEPSPRGVYCGAVGVIAPGGALRLNVAIRTLTVDADGRGTLGIGGGLLADSGVVAEYEECLLKSQFLTREDPSFDLIETLAWTPREGYRLLDEHLTRLEQSALYFGFDYAQGEVRAALERIASGFGAPRRVRLALSGNGRIGLTDSDLPDAGGMRLKAIVSARPVRSRDPFLYHKTSRRDFFDSELARHAGADEVLFCNEEGLLTEGTRTNIFLKRGPVFLTPALECGLLAGTLRARLIAEGKAREARLTRGDLLAAPDALHLGNSVRGLLPAELIGLEEPASPPPRTGRTTPAPG